MAAIGESGGAVDRDEDVSELELKIARYERAGGVADTETCVIKKGPRAYKTVTLSSFINSETARLRSAYFKRARGRAIGTGPV